VTPSRRRWAAALSIAVGLVALVLLALAHAGTSLVVEDPLEHASAAVVFGGRTPFRALEAARLYKAGWADEIWLTEGGWTSDDVALSELGVERTPEHVYNRQVLEHHGVPGTAIRVVETRNNNTAQEVRTIGHAIARSGADRVILITSTYHTRRVRMLWRTLVGNRPAAIVRYTRDESFDPAHWWSDTADVWSVSREWFGLLNAWAGFPVASEHW
jgi:uncharacterized SAM-binding protein YcdF (DUF218 family)